ncbi:MAG TPA: CoA transferase [Methylomirabilota bacterium]|nr:CoA transferase [Methylomirabilota bacterium]
MHRQKGLHFSIFPHTLTAEEGKTMSGPLTGIRVLDFGRAAVGPVSAQYLGFLGADVIKIEPPEGDPVRHVATFKKGMGTTFLGNNLTKRGIVLDLKEPQDKEFALRLIQWADIVIENFRSGEVMERLGLGYRTLSELNPRVIYLSSGAYGNAGPMQGMTSNEWYGQASSGATSVTGQAGGPFEFVRGIAQFDWNGAMINLEAMLTALYVRERTGRGMMIETSQFQSSLVAGTTRFAEYFATGQAPTPLGSGRPNLVPDQAFATADGYINVSVPHEGFWKKFCDAIGRADWQSDARFATNAARIENRNALIAELTPIFRTQPTGYWLWQLRKHDAPCGQYCSDDLVSNVLQQHPQVQANKMMTIIESQWGPMHSAMPHWRFSKTPAAITRPSPALDEHHHEIVTQVNREVSQTKGDKHTMAKAANGALALSGLKVIDVSQGAPGAMCSMQLGDLGAEVIKVEPLDGDWVRNIGPFIKSESSLFVQLNRNKRSIALDLKTPSGKDICRRLLAEADVVVEGYRPGVMERLGFGYDAVAALNPRAVYCSISAFGRKGPLARQPGTELAIQSFVGVNRNLGRAGEPPLRAGFDLAATETAFAAFQGVLAALFWRMRHGEGQHVDVSMLGTMIAVSQWQLAAEHDPDEWAGRQLLGYTEPPDFGFQLRDGAVLFSLRGDGEAWDKFFLALNRPDLAADPRFAVGNLLVINRDLEAAIRDDLQQWSVEEFRHLVQDELGGTITILQTLHSVMQSEQTAAIGAVQTIEHPVCGKMLTLSPPWKFSEPLTALRRPAPLLGQHTDEILREYGYAQEEITAFRAQHIVR